MISVRRWARWAATSQEQALRNAREASVVCSRARLERAEVEAYLSSLTPQIADRAARSGARGR